MLGIFCFAIYYYTVQLLPCIKILFSNTCLSSCLGDAFEKQSFDISNVCYQEKIACYMNLKIGYWFQKAGQKTHWNQTNNFGRVKSSIFCGFLLLERTSVWWSDRKKLPKFLTRVTDPVVSWQVTRIRWSVTEKTHSGVPLAYYCI